METKEVDAIINETFKQASQTQIEFMVDTLGVLNEYAELDKRTAYNNMMEAKLREFKRNSYRMIFGNDVYKELSERKEETKKSMISMLDEKQLEKLKEFYTMVKNYISENNEVPDFSDVLFYKGETRPTLEAVRKQFFNNDNDATALNRYRTFRYFKVLGE